MITNGSVKYTLPAAYAENRPGTEVTLHFAVPDGAELTYAEGMLVYAGDLARVQAQRLQNGEAVVTPIPADHPAITGEPAKPRRTRKAAEVPAGDPLSQAGSAPQTAGQTTAPASDPLASTATGPALDAVGKPIPSSSTSSSESGGPVASDPLSGAATPNASVAPTTTAPVGVTDPLSNGAGATIPVPAANGSVAGVSAGVTVLEIANADLTKAIMGAMQTLSPVYGNEVAAARVGETIRNYAPEAAQIPVDKRAAFVEQLRVLA